MFDTLYIVPIFESRLTGAYTHRIKAHIIPITNDIDYEPNGMDGHDTQKLKKHWTNAEF
jgi:hypothetical protein